MESKQHSRREGRCLSALSVTVLNGSKEKMVCTFSKTHINEVTRFLANTARYSPPTFFTMESTKYKTGSFSEGGAWSNRELNKFRKQQGLKTNISASTPNQPPNQHHPPQSPPTKTQETDVTKKKKKTHDKKMKKFVSGEENMSKAS